MHQGWQKILEDQLTRRNCRNVQRCAHFQLGQGLLCKPPCRYARGHSGMNPRSKNKQTNKSNLIFMNNFRSRRDGRNARRCAHFHIVQRQHESWWMDFLSQINHAFNSSDFKIPYFIAQWSHKNSWNRQSSFPLWFYDFFLRQFGISCISMKVVNQLPSDQQFAKKMSLIPNQL